MKRLAIALCLLVSCRSAPHAPNETLTLRARDASTHGEKLRYEPEPHKDTLGYWTNVDDWAEWPVKIDRSGTFEVHILQGCGAGQGGSEVQVSLGDDLLTFIVEDTGHFQNFKWRNVGRLTVDSPGRHELQVRPVKLASRAVMDLRQVRLVRID